jgi:hypothetical protein
MKRYFALLILAVLAVLVGTLTYTRDTRLQKQRVSQSGHDANVSESPGRVGGPPTGEAKLSHIGEPTNNSFSSIRQAPEVHAAGGREQFSGDRDDIGSVDGALQLFNAPGAPRTRALQGDSQNQESGSSDSAAFPQRIAPKPIVSRLQRAGRSFDGDVRDLPYEKLVEQFRREPEDPVFTPRYVGPPANETAQSVGVEAPAVAAPTPLLTFDGLDRFTWGAGSPPDTNGDAGPNHYIQTVNTSVGIFNKTTGAQITAFTFNTLMSQGSFGNLCDTNNFGDPVVLYDTFEDRWIITDFAFLLDGGGNVLAPAFQCFAASKTADPVAGGWNFYSIQLSDALNDYPKFGIWPDGLYMTTNLFSFGAGSSFQGVRVWAFNKAQMYAGAPTVQNVSFNVGGGDFTVIPSNARLQVGTPPIGTPNYFLSTELFLNALTIYKFHVDWDRISLSTFTGPDVPIAATSWPNANVANAAQPGTATLLDVLQIRAMVQNQYTNFAGTESLWAPHTVRRGDTSGLAAPRWYQVNVTGGTVNAALPQATTWDPDGANVINRFMPSLALDRAGNMALGYSTSSGTAFPSIKYAGRLSTDPVNTFSLTETSLFDGTASQTGTTRWGDYSAMTLDPDGCTFWYTSEYANPADQTFDHRWLTKVGKFKFSPCTTIGSGTLQGTVTVTPGGAPISGATVAFGARTTTTNGAGFYSFAAIPAGTYPTETASKPAFVPGTTTNIVVNESATTVKDFALAAAPASSCLTDTTQADFQTGVFTSLDLDTTPGNVTLSNAPTVDQSNTAGTTTGTGPATITAWQGQTFIPAVTGTLVKADVQLFCSGCTGTIPNLTLSVRATSAGLPTGADLATATIPGFSSGAGVYYTATFGAPPSLTSGTQYALLLRPVANPSVGAGYFWIRSSPSTYANGQRVLSADSGTTWSADATRDFNFRAYMSTGFAAAGNLVSSVKDANPGGAAIYPHWATMSWNATVPANTTLKFQAAGSNSQFGPFNFVGPDGTAATFFTTSPANITQFNGNRYLKYKAFLTTTNSAVTPTVNDVTVCFNDTAAPTAAPATIAGTVTAANGSPLAGVVLTLSGQQSATAITEGNGNYRFGGVDTDSFYTVTPQLANYHFSPANRSFSLLADKTDAVFTGSPDATESTNAIDTNEYFVRQQYLDFLGREPDQGGFDYWVTQLNQCGSDADCTRTKRVEVSAAFFQSQEFQETGSFVYRLYQAALGRQLTYAEFSADRQQVVGGSNLAESKTAFANSFVARSAFTQKYQATTTAESFVDAMLQTLRDSASVDLASERANLIARYQSGGSMNEGRALVLRDVGDNTAFASAVYNPSFVLMEYFGYLRRGEDRGGYDFWLNVLNNSNNYRGMVCSFITSTEYQRRFGSVVTRSNAECGR